MPAADERLRRSPGWLADRIVDLLGRTSRPLGATAIAELLRGQEGIVHDSAVFRVLLALTGAGRVEKVHLLAAYRLRQPGTLALICPDCGTYAEATCPGVAEDLAMLSVDNGHRPWTVVLECRARCGACLRNGRASPDGHDAGVTI